MLQWGCQTTCVCNIPCANMLISLHWRHNDDDGVTSLTVVYSTVYSDADQRKYQSSTSLAFVRRIHRGPHKWSVTRKMFPFDDVIMMQYTHVVVFTEVVLHNKHNLVRQNAKKRKQYLYSCDMFPCLVQRKANNIYIVTTCFPCLVQHYLWKYHKCSHSWRILSSCAYQNKTLSMKWNSTVSRSL